MVTLDQTTLSNIAGTGTHYICESIEGKCPIKNSYTVQCVDYGCVYFPPDTCLCTWLKKVEHWSGFTSFFCQQSSFSIPVNILYTSKHFLFFFISKLKDFKFSAYHFYTQLICSISLYMHHQYDHALPQESPHRKSWISLLNLTVLCFCSS